MKVSSAKTIYVLFYHLHQFGKKSVQHQYRTPGQRKLDLPQWRIQRVLDAGIPVWAPKLCAQIIEKCLK